MQWTEENSTAEAIGNIHILIEEAVKLLLLLMKREIIHLKELVQIELSKIDESESNNNSN